VKFSILNQSIILYDWHKCYVMRNDSFPKMNVSELEALVPCLQAMPFSTERRTLSPFQLIKTNSLNWSEVKCSEVKWRDQLNQNLFRSRFPGIPSEPFSLHVIPREIIKQILYRRISYWFEKFPEWRMTIVTILTDVNKIGCFSCHDLPPGSDHVSHAIGSYNTTVGNCRKIWSRSMNHGVM
jgi:hypothetical protein